MEAGGSTNALDHHRNAVKQRTQRQWPDTSKQATERRGPRSESTADKKAGARNANGKNSFWYTSYVLQNAYYINILLFWQISQHCRIMTNSTWRSNGGREINTGYWSAKVEERHHLEDLSADGKTVNLILNTIWRRGVDLSGSAFVNKVLKRWVP